MKRAAKNAEILRSEKVSSFCPRIMQGSSRWLAAILGIAGVLAAGNGVSCGEIAGAPFAGAFLGEHTDARGQSLRIDYGAIRVS
jgi:hypothetical protein